MAGSVVIIQELEGKKRRVILSGSALPLQGAEWGVELAMSTTWNPGNSEGTQQTLNPKEMPSNWDFEWRTNRLISTPVGFDDGAGQVRTGADGITRAFDLHVLMEDIVRSSVLLRVTWTNRVGDEIRGKISRLGRARQYTIKVARGDDMEATIEYEWLGRSTAQPKPGDIRGNSDLNNRNEAQRASERVANLIILNSQEARDEGKLKAQKFANQFTLGQLESIAEAPLTLMNDFAVVANGFSSKLKNLGEIINTVKETPASIASRSLDIANNGVSVATNFLDTISREGPETQATRTKVATLTRTASYFSGVQTQTDFMVGIYQRLAEQSRLRRSAAISSAGSSRRGDEMRNEDNFQVHIPRQGETFASIAKKFYQDADLGDELAVANGQPAYTINPPNRGPIIIPTRRSLESSNRNRV